jgi:hypothetical protein
MATGKTKCRSGGSRPDDGRGVRGPKGKTRKLGIPKLSGNTLPTAMMFLKIPSAESYRKNCRFSANSDPPPISRHYNAVFAHLHPLGILGAFGVESPVFCGMDTDDLQMPVLNQRSVVRWREVKDNFIWHVASFYVNPRVRRRSSSHSSEFRGTSHHSSADTGTSLAAPVEHVVTHRPHPMHLVRSSSGMPSVSSVIACT